MSMLSFCIWLNTNKKSLFGSWSTTNFSWFLCCESHEIKQDECPNHWLYICHMTTIEEGSFLQNTTHLDNYSTQFIVQKYREAINMYIFFAIQISIVCFIELLSFLILSSFCFNINPVLHCTFISVLQAFHQAWRIPFPLVNFQLYSIHRKYFNWY